MILLDNQTNYNFDLERLEEIAKAHTKKDIELLIVDSKTIRSINKAQRAIDKATDVLSFPLEGFDHMPLGSIVINSELAIKKANELGHTPKEEIILLFIHGLLHLLGYDHEVDSGEMREKEKELITKHNLPSSLIVRST